MKTILGIDPGLQVTGFGIIKSDGITHSYLTSGCIRTKKTSLAARLNSIFQELDKMISTYAPQEAGIEQIFMHNNAGSALKLGQARGAALVALVNNDLLVAEYSARQVKKAVVGNGAANKAQVQYMVKALLKLDKTLAEDAADALAIAICHANSMRLKDLL